MDADWWLALLAATLIALIGWLLSWIRYRLELRRYYGRELFTAGSNLLMALHALNNAHQGREDFGADEETFLVQARETRDEVWRHSSQLLLIGSEELRQATEHLVAEYNSSSPDRGNDRKNIDWHARKILRDAFIAQWRRECPGLPTPNRWRSAS